MDRIDRRNIILIFLLTVFVFSIGFRNSFLTFDDPDLILNNPRIRSLSVDNILNIMTPHSGASYQPLRDISYAIDYAVAGTSHTVIYLHNLLLYLVNIFLVYLILARLFNRRELAFWVTAMFALHPVHIESVVWASARKDVLSGAFFFLAIALYITGGDRLSKKGWWKYILSFIFFVLSVLAKQTTVTLPFVLLLLAFFLDRAKRKERLLFLIPFFLITVFPVFFVLFKSGVLSSHFRYGNPYISLLTAVRIFGEYIRILFFPYPLSHFYDVPLSTAILDWRVILPLFAFLFCIFLLWLGVKNRDKYLIFGVLFFFITYLPVSNIVPLLMKADRYLYLPLLGFLVLLIGGISVIKNKRILLCIFLILLIFWGGLNIRRQLAWRDTRTLCLDSLREDPENPYILHQLATYFYNTGNYDVSIWFGERSLSSMPWNISLHRLLVRDYLIRGEYFKALSLLSEIESEAEDSSLVAVQKADIYSILGSYEASDNLLAYVPRKDAEFVRAKNLFRQGKLDSVVCFLSPSSDSAACLLYSSLVLLGESPDTQMLKSTEFSSDWTWCRMYHLVDNLSDKNGVVRFLNNLFWRHLVSGELGLAERQIERLTLIGASVDTLYLGLAQEYFFRKDFYLASVFAEKSYTENPYCDNLLLLIECIDSMKIYPQREIALIDTAERICSDSLLEKIDSMRQQVASRKVTLEDVWVKGLNFFNNGNYIEAKKLFESLVSSGKESSDFLSALGACYASLGDYTAARDVYLKLVSISPDRSDGYFYLGVVYARLGEPDETKRSFQRFLELAPDDDIRREYASRWLYRYGG